MPGRLIAVGNVERAVSVAIAGPTRPREGIAEEADGAFVAFPARGVALAVETLAGSLIAVAAVPVALAGPAEVAGFQRVAEVAVGASFAPRAGIRPRAGRARVSVGAVVDKGARNAAESASRAKVVTIHAQRAFAGAAVVGGSSRRIAVETDFASVAFRAFRVMHTCLKLQFN